MVFQRSRKRPLIFFIITIAGIKKKFISLHRFKNDIGNVSRFIVADSVAQLVEQYTFNVWVLGSNPSRVTNLLKSKFFSY